MKRKHLKPPLPSAAVSIIRRLGRSIRVARLRRRWTQALLAEKVGVSTPTIQNLERGKPGVSLGVLVTVLWALGLEDALAPLMDPAEDQTGAALGLAQLGHRVRRTQKIDDDF
ncbi:MAG: helix-turn-helix domain-containing protein [Gemmatimonadales bacterium]|nr:helix-turn-helix domain-containing protein [Gemmatimonadales bacterium]MDZ4390616.1 helix-turn-helix domain-containing protein [Gemmatimonadales bacterium]